MSDIFDEVENELLLKEIFGEDYNDLDIIQEGTVYRNNNLSIGIFGDYGNKLITLPYFKVFDNINLRHASKIARITFEDPHYIIHDDNLLHWDLTVKEKEKLNSIVRLPGKNGTIWDDMISEIENICNISDYEFRKRFHINGIPDFIKLYYKKGDWAKAKAKGIGR